jgi:succinate dehydrogenase / fumarate reductase membrane anchor subunit
MDMVTNIAGLSGNGVYDWLVQRVSAVVLLAYFLFLAFYVGTSPDLTYVQWQGLFASNWMRAFSILALISLCLHTWIGIWTISTDYLTSALLGNAAAVVRLWVQLLCLLVLFAYFAWCVQILWSI